LSTTEKDYEHWVIQLDTTWRVTKHIMDFLGQHWFDTRDSAIDKTIQLDTDSEMAIRTIRKIADDLEDFVRLMKA